MSGQAALAEEFWDACEATAHAAAEVQLADSAFVLLNRERTAIETSMLNLGILNGIKAALAELGKRDMLRDGS